jgi:hypothetical protein
MNAFFTQIAQSDSAMGKLSPSAFPHILSTEIHNDYGVNIFRVIVQKEL